MTQEDITAAAVYVEAAGFPDVAALLREISPAFNPPADLRAEGAIGTLITKIPQCVFLFPGSVGGFRDDTVRVVRAVSGLIQRGPRVFEISGDVVTPPGGKFITRIRFNQPPGGESQ